jgi:hypothetical protein
MSSIRRQSIISSLLIYVGFAFGALNTYLFIKDGLFTPEQYGLTRAFIVMGQFFYGFASFGLASVFYKFYPYYKDNIAKQDKNDLLTITLLVAFVDLFLQQVQDYYLKDWLLKNLSRNRHSFSNIITGYFPLLFFCSFFHCSKLMPGALARLSYPIF